jgi:hypothetical protein
MKVIFLDIDGVLCTTRAHVAYATGLLMRHYDPTCTRILARLCRETSAKIVLSSTWRLTFNLSHMDALLMNAGFEDVPWHQAWRTPDLSTSRMYGDLTDTKRGDEIERWMSQHGRPERYVIIDDDTDMLESQKPYFIQTDTHEGFGFKEYEKARELLGKPL